MMKRLRQASQANIDTTNGRQDSNLSPRDSKNNMSSPTNQKPMLGQIGKGPSLIGLLAAKRFTRKMQSKYGRSNSMYASSKNSNSVTLQREPTYRMEPQRKFDTEKVEGIIRDIVESRMSGLKYHPKFCPNMCKIISDDIKDSVKKLRFDRYKIVALVHIGEKKDQSTVVASRCAWDQAVDSYATYAMTNATLFCTASVYGIYNE